MAQAQIKNKAIICPQLTIITWSANSDHELSKNHQPTQRQTVNCSWHEQDKEKLPDIQASSAHWVRSFSALLRSY